MLSMYIMQNLWQFEQSQNTVFSWQDTCIPLLAGQSGPSCFRLTPLFRLLQKPDTPGLWVKCRTAELECGRYAEWKMRNDGDWSTGQTTWPHRSYYAVYHTLHVAGAAANCVMQTWKVAFCACYDTLAFAAKCVSLKHTHMKTNYYNNTKR